jgi:hypothetical protein
MVPVIDAIAGETLGDQEAIWRTVKKAQERFRESEFALSERLKSCSLI